MIFWTSYVHACNQLGTPEGLILGGPKFFKLCLTHFFRAQTIF